ncbi:phosphate ABC transporter substrate-binding protein PstS [Thalassospira marina]|uniref:Phosphate-binding protein PstS n=1 Tax=Thalassospira marina TaxID=2048283 RepID=A0A2N3L0C9_9PROT|nr:phosphate ABC transporter substrate-binding protein PstS [Thalassospira marina]AUG52259.1 phosphate ABC transporter substrate-binding protein PstS [Thalassospira marina]PKR56180.1 phosphate ABC transporter substrate-binding protein PstS [Thalassospira marina]
MLTTFKKSILGGAALLMAAGVFASAQATEISGAGATFPYPVYAKWAEAYEAKTGVKMNYQSIGSGGGIKQIKASTVDFGASDAPLTKEELDEAGLVQWPMIMGGVVPVVNIKGIKGGDVKLSGQVLADIYLGKITKWDDKAIADLNPDLKLPSEAISVVERSDGSGTTFNFTNYLAAVSPEWKDSIGVNKSVQWPVGVGGKGNEGVASYTKQIDGSIGYVEYAYALQNDLAYTQMQNKDGEFVSPTAGSFAAAAANADWANAPGYYLILGNQPGAKSWPITAASFILVHKSQDNAETAKEVLKFFDWSFKNGSDIADKLDYVAMPENVVDMVEKTWTADVKGSDGKKIW